MGEQDRPSGNLRTFGRIHVRPDLYEGRPFLQDSHIEVAVILDHIRDKMNDKDIVAAYRDKGLSQSDIDACRAWQARFEPGTLSKIFNRVSNQNVIMLDENMSYKLLYEVVKLFGRSSHVYADGLCAEHNDDEGDIWAHMVKHKYAAIITADNDFKRISHDHRERMIRKYGSLENCPEHIPAVIFIPRAGAWEQTRDLLTRYADDIRAYIETNQAICAELTRSGLTPITHITHFKAPPPPRRHRPPGNDGHAPAP